MGDIEFGPGPDMGLGSEGSVSSPSEGEFLIGGGSANLPELPDVVPENIRNSFPDEFNLWVGGIIRQEMRDLGIDPDADEDALMEYDESAWEEHRGFAWVGQNPPKIEVGGSLPDGGGWVVEAVKEPVVFQGPDGQTLYLVSGVVAP